MTTEAVAIPTAPDTDLEAAWRTLLYRVDHPSPAAQGVSSTALQRLCLTVEALAEIEAPAVDASARRVVRYLTCLIPENVPDRHVADIVTQVCDHPALPLEVVRDILRGDAPDDARLGRRELPASKLRAIANMLRRGIEGRVVRDTLGVAYEIVKEVSLWLGVVDARSEALADAATAWVEGDGGSQAAFAEAHGIGIVYAGRLIRAAKRAAEQPL